MFGSHLYLLPGVFMMQRLANLYALREEKGWRRNLFHVDILSMWISCPCGYRVSQELNDVPPSRRRERRMAPSKSWSRFSSCGNTKHSKLTLVRFSCFRSLFWDHGRQFQESFSGGAPGSINCGAPMEPLVLSFHAALKTDHTAFVNL